MIVRPTSNGLIGESYPLLLLLLGDGRSAKAGAFTEPLQDPNAPSPTSDGRCLMEDYRHAPWALCRRLAANRSLGLRSNIRLCKFLGGGRREAVLSIHKVFSVRASLLARQ